MLYEQRYVHQLQGFDLESVEKYSALPEHEGQMVGWVQVQGIKCSLHSHLTAPPNSAQPADTSTGTL